MITHYMKSILIAVLFFLLASACNPAKLVERGRFDDAIELSVRKLSGKKNKKLKYVRAAEESFARSTQKDMRRAKALEKEGQAENWVEINRIYRRIEKRQQLIEPLLPLYASDGYKADFKFVRIEGLVSESKEKAADFYYNEGQRLLDMAHRGDKQAARDAYRMFEKVGNYFNRYRDRIRLMQRAEEMGIVHVLLKIENQSNTILPSVLEQELKKISVRDLESKWQRFHLRPDRSTSYDYHAVMKFREIAVSPDLIREREYVDDAVIEDGWEYVLDQNGNVVKDSAGNDVKIPVKVFIKASVLETYQSKSAIVSADLDFFDNIRKEWIYSEPVTAEAHFENYAATFRGDRRALTKDSKRKIGNQPLPFPSGEALILQAAEHLKPLIREKITQSRKFI